MSNPNKTDIDALRAAIKRVTAKLDCDGETVEEVQLKLLLSILEVLIQIRDRQ